MAQNYILLERIELNASAASVTFSNIPQSGYTDLKIVVSARCDAAYERRIVQLQFNGATTNYSDRYLQGYNGTAGSGTNTGGTYIELRDIDGATATSNTFSNMEIYVPNYTSSNYKSVSTDGVTETNGALAMNAFTASLWSSTSAISSITLTPGNGSFVQYSTFSLYGLAAVGTTPGGTSAPKAFGGDIIKNDGTYWYHAFVSTGTFTPFTGLTADVLTVAGGGGASTNSSGGGGAGGLVYSASQTLTAINYAVTVGSGGAGSADGANASKGGNSQFAALTAAEGGGGAYGRNAGSGTNMNGGCGAGQVGGTGNTGTGSQGYAGGGGSNSAPNYGGGGGGGMGAVGGNGSSTAGGAGGNGLSTYSSWGSATNTGQNVSGTYYYAGGGGGGINASSSGSGAGGYGGGGAAVPSGTAVNNGTANTGGGGGAVGYPGTGGNGGSGIVIIRYAMA